MADSEDGRPASKVGRLIDAYDLDGLGAELEARWTGEVNERMSLRDLADFFNKRLLERALRTAGESALENDVETIYEHLTSDEVSSGVRTDTWSRLEQNGLGVETLESDFVTYQAIRFYLKEWRGAEYQGLSDEDKREKDREAIQRMLTRAHSVIEERLQNLEATDRLALADFEVLLDILVLCQECGTRYTVTELIEQGGCDCQLDDSLLGR